MKNGNVLVPSISKKVPLLKAVKKAVNKIDPNMKIFGADLNSNAIGRYFVDSFWQMPSLDKITINEIIQFCRKNHITSIIPTRDGELHFFAKHKNILEENEIFVMVSNKKTLDICLDKYLFWKKLKFKYPIITTEMSVYGLECQQFVVKERFGAGTQSIGLRLSKDEVKNHAKKLKQPIFQPYIDGFEASIDLYALKTGAVKGIVARKREFVVNGESQITTTFHDEHLENLCVKMARDLHLYGHNLIQVIIDQKGEYHILECNSRFGGASTLSLAAGLDSFFWFFLEVIGEEVNKYPFVRSDRQKKLVRYAEDLIL